MKWIILGGNYDINGNYYYLRYYEYDTGFNGRKLKKILNRKVKYTVIIKL